MGYAVWRRTNPKSTRRLSQKSSSLLLYSSALYEYELRPSLPCNPEVNWLRPATAFLQFATILISISPHHDVSSRLQKKLELLSLKRKSTSTLMREMHQRRMWPYHRLPRFLEVFLLSFYTMYNFDWWVISVTDFGVDFSLRSYHPSLFPTREKISSSLIFFLKPLKLYGICTVRSTPGRVYS